MIVSSLGHPASSYQHALSASWISSLRCVNASFSCFPSCKTQVSTSWMDFFKQDRKAKQKFMVVFESLLSPWLYLGNCITTIIWLLTTNFQTKHHGPAPWPQKHGLEDSFRCYLRFSKNSRPSETSLPQASPSPLKSSFSSSPCALLFAVDFPSPLWLHTQSDVALGMQNMINMQCLVLT